MGISVCEFTQVGQKTKAGERCAGSYRQVADPKLVVALEFCFTCFQGGKSLRYMLVQDHPLIGEGYTAGSADKKTDSDPLFQTADGFADSGLADEKLARSAGYAAGLRDNSEYSILRHVPVHSGSLL